MNHVYVLQNENGHVVGAAYEESRAVKACKDSGMKWTYRCVPFFLNEGTEIKVIAGPIPKEFLPSSERTLMGDFKADAE